MTDPQPREALAALARAIQKAKDVGGLVDIELSTAEVLMAVVSRDPEPEYEGIRP